MKDYKQLNDEIKLLILTAKHLTQQAHSIEKLELNCDQNCDCCDHSALQLLEIEGLTEILSDCIAKLSSMYNILEILEEKDEEKKSYLIMNQVQKGLSFINKNENNIN